MFTAVACLSRSVRLHPCTRDSGGPGTLVSVGSGRCLWNTRVRKHLIFILRRCGITSSRNVFPFGSASNLECKNGMSGWNTYPGKL